MPNFQSHFLVLTLKNKRVKHNDSSREKKTHKNQHNRSYIPNYYNNKTKTNQNKHIKFQENHLRIFIFVVLNMTMID